MTPETFDWIEQQKPRLVRWAEDFVDTTKLYRATRKTASKDPGWRTPEVRANQLRNLLSAAQSGSPLAVLVNFLRYQIGRQNQGWAHRESGKELDALLTEKLGKLIPERLAEHRYQLEAHLAAQLLGFIIRHYTYQCSLAGTRS